MDTISRFAPLERAERIGVWIGDGVGAAVRLALIWIERGRGRRLLSQLDDRMMQDIGITRADVMIESSKPFWRE